MHTDPELLSLLALGEQVGTHEDRLHLQTCTACAAELADLENLVALGRGVDVETALTAPGPEVWTRIRDELALSRAADVTSAHAILAPVEASWSRASGTAALATDERGRRILQVTLKADLPHSGVRQAWLIHHDDPTRKQTVGILDGPHGLWTVDRSIDLEQYAVLEISQQGTSQAEHSGDTIVRGQLTVVR